MNAYKTLNIEPYDVMDACMTPEQIKGFYRGNIIKYIMRMEAKGQEVSDVRKALDYCRKLLEWEEKYNARAGFAKRAKQMLGAIHDGGTIPRKEIEQLLKSGW